MKGLILFLAIATVLAMGAGLFTREAKWDRRLDRAPIQTFVVERQMGADDITLKLAGWGKQSDIPREYLRERFWSLNGESQRALQSNERVKFPLYHQ